MKTLIYVVIAVVVASLTAGAGDGSATPDPAIMKALEGMKSYSHKTPYSGAISDMFIGYNADGKPCVAVALRQFKTYEKVTAMAVVREKDGAFVIDQAQIHDITKIKDADKLKKATDALLSIAGKQIADKDGTTHTVDAVTGATRYLAGIYESFNLITQKAAEVLRQPPSDWPRIELSKP